MPKATLGSGGSNQNAPVPKGAPAQFHDQDVEITGAGQLRVERGMQLLGGAPVEGTVKHDWGVDGWAPFRERLISAQGTGSVTASVVNGKGRLQGHAHAGDGNHRTCFLHEGTNFEDVRVKVLWSGTDQYNSSTATPQGGLILRGQEDADGNFTGVAISNNIFLTDPNVYNQNTWRSDRTGVQLTLGNAGGQKDWNDQLTRRLQIQNVERTTGFGIWFNLFAVTPEHMYGLKAGDLATVSMPTDTTFNVTNGPVVGIDVGRGAIQQHELTVGEQVLVATKFAQGTVVPQAAFRYWPMWMIAELRGQVLRIKVWKHLDPEPPWGTVANTTTWNLASTTQYPPPAGRGLCGIISAHQRSSSWMDWDQFEVTPLLPAAA